MRSALFDLDGTMLDTAPDFYRVICQQAQNHGYAEPDFQLIRDNASNGGKPMLKAAFPEQLIANETALHNEFLSLYRSNPVESGGLFPGFNEALSWLEEQQIPWGIVTNKPRELTDIVLEQLQLTDRCSVCICPEDVSQSKPDPEGIIKALKTVDATAEHSLYFGDHIRDIVAGKAAGTPTVACTFGYLAQSEDYREWQATHALHQSENLLSFLSEQFI
ncbi:Phosphoglycolate phosphatase [Marinobacterium sp. xm-d-579]|uniref:HAD family hydrolase n=1 Tax=Marinobacterium sp. xm-d-579 TaxID=2497734 RepID=UPI00156A241C|nr:HAD family hydrolase [Marinobacterium sp. xm-d-579]NRP37154.1 Phosphoglycolate phosphatase [Marinobacterium sp. xm-d-579]